LKLSFFHRQEDALLAQIVAYAELTQKCNSELLKLLEVLKSGGDIRDVYHRVDLLETEADNVHERLAEYIASGSFFSYIREDFLQLLEKIDYIADYSKDVGKMFVGYNIDHNSIDFFLKQCNAIEFFYSIQKSISALITVLNLLHKSSPMEIIRSIKEVEKYEEDADSKKDAILRSLFNSSDKLKILDIITLRDIVNIADNIADSAEDSSDIVLQLIAKGYK
jgi:predicted phosphate transport protein (TIGR00153 family)